MRLRIILLQRPLLQKHILYTKHARYDEHDRKKVISLTIETNVQHTQKLKKKPTQVTHDKFRDTWTVVLFLLLVRLQKMKKINKKFSI